MSLISEGRPILVRCRITLALLSFIIFATSVHFLHQDHTSEWTVEREPLAAAISNVVHQSPPGRLFQNVLVYLRTEPGSTSDKVESLGSFGTPSQLGVPMQWTPDGNGIGYLLYATAAMHLFGVHVSSLIDLFFVFLGVSTAAFILRFRDDRLLFVPLLFAGLCAVLLTPLIGAETNMDEAPIGGARSFVIIGLLPALHLILEILDRTNEPRLRLRDFATPGFLIVIQSIILAWTLFIRANAAGLILAIAIAAVYSVWSNRRDGRQIRVTISKTAFSATVGALTAAFLLLSAPGDYLTTGRAFGVVWHRIFLSFGANPHWPFPGLREKYDCTWSESFRQGLVPGIRDANAQCVWFADNRDRLVGDLNVELFDRDYERSMRQAVFDVVLNYPRQTLATLIYYKPILMEQTLVKSLDFSYATGEPYVLALAIVQWIVLTIFTALGCFAFGGNNLRQGLIFAGFAVLTLPQYFLVWARVYTATDIIVYLYVFIALGFAAIVQFGTLRLAGAGHRKFQRPQQTGRSQLVDWLLARLRQPITVTLPVWTLAFAVLAFAVICAGVAYVGVAKLGKPVTSEIEVRSATYGENCGAPAGNVTDFMRAACEGKAACNYTVDVNVIGDPAPGCDKNFVVDYDCNGGRRRKASLARAGLRELLELSCKE